MNDDYQWKIEGYLLGDPQVDRAQFELDMLEHPELALKVAEVAEQLEIIARVASKQNFSLAATDVKPANQTSRAGASKLRKYLLVFSATAAAVVIAVLALPTVNKRGENRIDELANNWLAMETESNEFEAVPIAPVGSTSSDDHDLPVPTVSNSVTDYSDNSSDDWLLDSAVNFYSDTGF